MAWSTKKSTLTFNPSITTTLVDEDGINLLCHKNPKTNVWFLHAWILKSARPNTVFESVTFRKGKVKLRVDGGGKTGFFKAYFPWESDYILPFFYGFDSIEVKVRKKNLSPSPTTRGQNGILQRALLKGGAHLASRVLRPATLTRRRQLKHG